MIEIKNLTKQFGKLEVLKKINLTLNRGECIALIGPNGCGKTTLIKCVLGMVLPKEGDIRLNGKNIKKDYSYRHAVGYMPQIGRYPENMTIGQILSMMKSFRADDKIIDEELYFKFDLNNMLQKKMSTLSGGTTQKVGATLAFLFNPSVLILDEPTAGLDPLSAEILKDKIIKENKNEKLILITSHLLSELDDLVTQIIFMEEGNIIFHKNIIDIKLETGEQKISKAITHILRNVM